MPGYVYENQWIDPMLTCNLGGNALVVRQQNISSNYIFELAIIFLGANQLINPQQNLDGYKSIFN